jgi:hypothetical protein
MFAFFQDIGFFANIKGFREPVLVLVRKILVFIVFSWPVPVPPALRPDPARRCAPRRLSVIFR